MKAAGVKEQCISRLQFHGPCRFQNLLIFFQIRPQKLSLIQAGCGSGAGMRSGQNLQAAIMRRLGAQRDPQIHECSGGK